MQLGNLALGERNEWHAGKLEMLEERRDIGLIARHAIERFSEDDVELARLTVERTHVLATPAWTGTAPMSPCRSTGTAWPSIMAATNSGTSRSLSEPCRANGPRISW